MNMGPEVRWFLHEHMFDGHICAAHDETDATDSSTLAQLVSYNAPINPTSYFDSFLSIKCQNCTKQTTYVNKHTFVYPHSIILSKCLRYIRIAF